MKLVTVTWSYDDQSNIENSILYKSFLKKNDRENFYSIHFNRNNFKDLECEFSAKFGHQYDYILYRIYLLNDYFKTIELNDDDLILSDTNDVVCLGNINNIVTNPNYIIFSSEKHRYPNEESVKNWSPNYLYPTYNTNKELFLNGGLSCGKKEKYIELFEKCINNVFKLEYKNFGGDQGIFTYFFINFKDELIKIDETKYFLSTYLKSTIDFNKDNNGIFSIKDNSYPLFIHDNGWNYGSPKFINYFNLI
jgi:hypothetical protein